VLSEGRLTHSFSGRKTHGMEDWEWTRKDSRNGEKEASGNYGDKSGSQFRRLVHFAHPEPVRERVVDGERLCSARWYRKPMRAIMADDLHIRICLGALRAHAKPSGTALTIHDLARGTAGCAWNCDLVCSFPSRHVKVPQTPLPATGQSSNWSFNPVFPVPFHLCPR
jgi:hypothetical protein